MTGRCKNITFPQLCLRAVIKQSHKPYGKKSSSSPFPLYCVVNSPRILDDCPDNAIADCHRFPWLLPGHRLVCLFPSCFRPSRDGPHYDLRQTLMKNDGKYIWSSRPVNMVSNPVMESIDWFTNIFREFRIVLGIVFGVSRVCFCRDLLFWIWFVQFCNTACETAVLKMGNWKVWLLLLFSVKSETYLLSRQITLYISPCGKYFAVFGRQTPLQISNWAVTNHFKLFYLY